MKKALIITLFFASFSTFATNLKPSDVCVSAFITAGEMMANYVDTARNEYTHHEMKGKISVKLYAGSTSEDEEQLYELKGTVYMKNTGSRKKVKDYYYKMKETTKKSNKARVALSRKLCEIVYHVWKQGNEFDDKYI